MVSLLARSRHHLKGMIATRPGVFGSSLRDAVSVLRWTDTSALLYRKASAGGLLDQDDAPLHKTASWVSFAWGAYSSADRPLLNRAALYFLDEASR